MNERYAVIVSGRIDRIVLGKPHDCEAVPCGPDIAPGMLWDGRRFSIPPVPVREIEETASDPAATIARDPRVDALGPLLTEQIAAAFQAMRRELQTEIAIEHRRALEALTVASALAEGKQVDPGSFPALERLLRDEGRPITSDEITAAADEHTRRVIDLVAGEQ